MWDVPHNLLLGCQNKKVKITIRMCQDIDKHNATYGSGYANNENRHR